MWELDHKEAWVVKNWCFWTVVLEKTLENPLDCKEIQPVHPKGDQSWVFIRRTDAEVETPVLWLPDVKSWLIRKDPNAGKDWRQEEKGMCWWRNETPTLQSGLNLYILTLASYSYFILYPLHNNLQGKLPSTTIQRLYSAQAQGEITFSLAYLLQLRLCFGELPYQLRIHFVPGSVPFEESEKHPCVQAMFFSHGNKQDS